MSRRVPLLIAAALPLIAMASVASAGELKQIGQIPITLDVPLNGFDIGYVDTTTNRYYLTSSAHFFDPKVVHPGNNVLLVIDSNTDKLITTIGGLVHPAGVVTANHGTEAWVGDGDSTVKVIDLKAGKVVDTISTGGKERADEVAYDPKDGIFAVANGDDDPAFLTLISTKPGHKVLAKIVLPEASDGLEQTVYSPSDGMFYTDVPELNKQHAKGGMLKVDPKTLKKVAIYPIDNCRPHGNVLGINGDLFLGCNAGNTRNKDTLPPVQATFNIKTHKVRYIPGLGGSDMSGADNKIAQYYSASVGNPDPGAVLGVIDAKTLKIVQKIPTKGLAHSVVANPLNHHVYVPSAGGDFGGCGCIMVYAPQ